MKQVDDPTEQEMIHAMFARSRASGARLAESQAKAAKVAVAFIAEDAERARLKRADTINAPAMRDFRARLGVHSDHR